MIVITKLNIELKTTSKFDIKCRMPKSYFLDCVISGSITECDGFGYYGTKDKVSNIDCFESAPENMDYVYWYNK